MGLKLISSFVLEAEPDTDSVRFARAFRSTWKKIPLSWRRRILAHWHRPSRVIGKRKGPRIILRAKVFDRGSLKNPRFKNDATFAMASRSGDFLQFLAPAFDRMPLRIAEAVIAHELAHVVQFEANLWSCTRLEREADIIALAWGFPIYEVDEWAQGRIARYRHGLPVWRKRAG